MLEDIGRRCQHLIFACSARMQPIFARSFPDFKVVADPFHDEGSGLTLETDVQICLADAGSILRKDKSDFSGKPYRLKSDVSLAHKLRAKYKKEANGASLVGIAWKSNQLGFGTDKSIDLSEWPKVLATPGVKFVNLQYGDVKKEIEYARRELNCDVILDPSINPLQSMEFAMAQCAAMDLVISTSNTTVHSAACQGIPTWLILPNGRKNIWYWQLDTEQSVFYDTLRIFRSGSDEQDLYPPLADVMDRIQVALSNFVKDGSCVGKAKV